MKKGVNWREPLLAFVAGIAIVAAGTGVYLLVRDSGGGSNRPSGPTATLGPYPVLADGEYIDSLPTNIKVRFSGFDPVPLTYGASRAGAIAIVQVTGIVETIVPTPDAPTGTPGGITPTPWTVYAATVQQWIKGGNGQTEITMSEIGGVAPDGPHLFEGTFLAQVGRTYLVTLDPPTENSPGDADYIGALTGWSNFEVGDGVIHVLSEKNSWRLMGAFNLTPVDDFVNMVKEWVNGPPAVTPTSPPSITPAP